MDLAFPHGIDAGTAIPPHQSAIVLRGTTQLEVGRQMEESGFGYHDIALIERMDPVRPKHGFTLAPRDTLAKILNVPSWWFTRDDDKLSADR